MNQLSPTNQLNQMSELSAVPLTVPLTSGQVHVEYHRDLGHRLLECFGVVAAIASMGLLLWRAGSAVTTDDAAATPLRLTAFVVALLGGYVLADLVSGVVHFTFDRFFSVETPVLGKAFVAAFRMHHSDPKDITRHGFFATNGNNSLATCPLLFALLVLPVDYADVGQLFVVVLLVSLCVATFMTNQFHKWAHCDHPPAVVVWLQDQHIILPRRHHQLHHTHPYDTHYCITTGWLNLLLLRVGFWRRLAQFGRSLGLPHFTEVTPWEQVPGSPAFAERVHMQATRGR